MLSEKHSRMANRAFIATALVVSLFSITDISIAATNFSSKSRSAAVHSKEIVPPSQEIPLGEHLSYEVSWMGVNVGMGELFVKEKTVFNGRNAYHIVAVAKTNEFLSKIYPVRDEVHSWVDIETLQSLGSQKKVSEGFYRADERVTYDEVSRKGHYESLRSGEKKVFDISVPVHDALSAFYWARRQPMAPGNALKTTLNNGEKDYALEIDVLRREQKEVRGRGVHDTFLIEPKSRYQGILDKRGKVWVHLLNEPARTPLMFTLRTPFGPIVGVLQTPFAARPAGE